MADERLEEDALRVLRVYRFAAGPHHARVDRRQPAARGFAHQSVELTAIPAERIWGERHGSLTHRSPIGPWP